MSALIAAMSSASEPAPEVQEPGFPEEVGEIGVVVFRPERAVQIERRAGAVVEVAPRVCTGRASMSERNTTHQSRKLPRLPRNMSSRPPVRNVIGVLRIVDDVGDVGIAPTGPPRHRRRRARS
jgi:hypothetical protein